MLLDASLSDDILDRPDVSVALEEAFLIWDPRCELHRESKEGP